MALLVALCLALAAFTGCQNESSQVFSKAAEKPAPSSSTVEPADSELTIISAYVDRNTGIAALAKEFEKFHPGVTVTVIEGIPANQIGEGDAWNNFMESLATQLMSGEAPDILVDPGVLNPKKYAENGLVYDLYEWMDADPDFHRDDYYENLFRAFEYRGCLYTVPASFVIDAVYLNRNITDGVGESCQPWDTVDYPTLLSIYDRAVEKNLLADSFTLEYMDQKGRKALFQDVELPEYIDEEKGETSFDSPEFIRYLEETKRIPSNRLTSEGILSITGGEILQSFSDSNAQENTSLMLTNMVTLNGLTELSAPAPGCAGPLILASEEGTASFYADMPLTVPVSCKNPELAWEFIKFAIGPVQAPAYGELYAPEGGADILHGSLPVNKENMRSYGKLCAQADLALKQDPGFWTEHFDPASAECPLDDAFFDRLDRMIGGFTSARSRYDGLSKVISPILCQYYDTDILTAEDCARQIQEKATLYFGE